MVGVSNKEVKKICMSIQLGLIDSCRFMTSGLDKLASNLNDISFD